MLDTIVDVVSAACFVAGSLLALVASVALHRLGSTRARMHATTKPATLGVALCALGAVLQLDDVNNVTKVVVIVVLQLVGAPIGAHLLGRSVGGK
ncbi:MAG: cation:proton antiporter [Acidimicrobiales bacterium]